jgi:hypothetical protein
VIADFVRSAPRLYNPGNRRRAYRMAKDRQGLIKMLPL